MPVLIDALEARRLFATTWSTYAKLIGQDVAAEQFAELNGKGQTVAVIDTGIDYMHPNLGGGFGSTFKVVGGYDFVDNDADPRDSPNDGHGTEVAGMIAGKRVVRNDVIFQGIAPEAKLVALRAGTNAEGFAPDDVQGALQWVINNHKKYGITVVNLSIGLGSYTTEKSQIQFRPYYEKISQLGIAIVAAAGNDARIAGDTVTHPAAEPTVFAIGSIRGDNKISEFGERGQELDLLAPGDQVTTTKAGGGYATINGTSFSSPLVAGVFALLNQATNSLSADDMMSVLRTSSNTQYDDDGDAGIQSDRAYAQLDLPAALALAKAREKAGTIDYFAGSRRSAFDAAYDSHGVYHLAYHNTADGKLYYTARLNSGRWTSPVLIDRAAGVGQALSLAVDPTGKPAVAYYDGTNGDLKYAYLNNGSKWATITLDDKGSVGQNPSLTFTADGDAAIAYYRQTSGDLRLVRYSHLKDAWTRQTIDTAGDVGRSASIAYFRERTSPSGSNGVDNYDTLAIAYADTTNGNLKYWSENTSISTQVTYEVDDSGLFIESVASNVVTAPSPYVFRSTVADVSGVDHISLDIIPYQGKQSRAGSVRIAYQDTRNADVLYATRVPGAWQSLQVATGGEVGSSIDTYVDAVGNGHVVYYDRTKEGTYDAAIGSNGTRLGFIGRIGSGGLGASVAASRNATDVTLLGLNRKYKSFGTTEIV